MSPARQPHSSFPFTALRPIICSLRHIPATGDFIMAALQQTPITFRSRSPPSAQISINRTSQLSLTSTFIKLPKLRIKLRSTPLRRRGALGATMVDTVASRYASALADLAYSNGTQEQTAADVEKIEKIFSEEGVLDFFVNPTIDETKKREIIDEIAKSAGLQPQVVNFLNILLDTKRIDLIKDIVKEFEAVYNKLTETELAVVTSVVDLESEHLAEIAKGVQRLTGAKNVRIKTAKDPSLVAGFTVRYGNDGSKFIDMSIKKQLEDIASQLELGEIQLV